jgi:hypothetical protein
MGRAAGPVSGGLRLGVPRGRDALRKTKEPGARWPTARWSLLGFYPSVLPSGGHTSPAITRHDGRDLRRVEGCVLHHGAHASGNGRAERPARPARIVRRRRAGRQPRRGGTNDVAWLAANRPATLRFHGGTRYPRSDRGVPRKGGATEQPLRRAGGSFRHGTVDSPGDSRARSGPPRQGSRRITSRGVPVRTPEVVSAASSKPLRLNMPSVPVYRPAAVTLPPVRVGYPSTMAAP